ncbi:MAG: RNA polymerase subunit sigma [Bacilli bacterium]
MKKSNDYVDNLALYESLVKWQKIRESVPDAPLSNDIGKAILDISSNLARRWNFSGYTPDWKEQMIGDGVEAALKGIKNFDVTLYKNPYGYITKVCFRAFQNRIKKERRTSVTKYRYFVEEVYDSECTDMSAMVDVDFYQDMITKIADYDNGLKKKADENMPEEDDVKDIPLSGLGAIYGNNF